MRTHSLVTVATALALLSVAACSSDEKQSLDRGPVLDASVDSAPADVWNDALADVTPEDARADTVVDSAIPPDAPASDAVASDASTPDFATCLRNVPRKFEDSLVRRRTFVADGVHVGIVIEADPNIMGTFTKYELRRFVIQSTGSPECISNETALMYWSSHHNWDDHAIAQGSSKFDLHLYFDLDAGEFGSSLSVDEATPLELQTESDQVNPTD